MFENKKTNKILFLTDVKKTVQADNSSNEKGINAKGPNRDRTFLPYRWLGTLFVIFALTLILAPDFQLPITNMKLGDVSSFNIKAKKDFLLEDIAATRENKILARKNTLPVYDFDLKPIETRSSRVGKAFRHFEDFFTSHVPHLYIELEAIKSVLGASGEEFTREEKDEKRARKRELDEEAGLLKSIPAFGYREKEFMEMIAIDLSPKSLKTLRWHHYNPGIAEGINGLLRQVFTNGVVGDRELLESFGKAGITLRKIDTGEEQILRKTDHILDKEGLQIFLKKNISRFIDPEHTSLQRVTMEIVTKLVESNLTFNKQETELRKNKAEEAVKPVFFNIKKGEMIVREGERIGETQLQKLLGMNKESNIQDYLLSLLGLFIFFSLVFCLVWYYLVKHRKDLVANGHNLILLGAIILVNFLIFRLLAHFAQPIAVYLDLPVGSVYYALPFAAGPMLAVLLFDLDIGILLTILNFALVGTHLEWNLGYSLMALVGGFFSVLRKNFYKQRSSILKNGIFIGLLNVAMVVPLDLINHTLISHKGIADLTAGFIGGIMVTLVVSWLLPAFESIFHVNSDITLQEISNLNHPLLRKMIVEAPGTYHHSIVVSTLAEGAAEVVGANPLLIRVGAYYHDIGKMKKPQYFIENQISKKNKHDKLAPSMSALIVASHVKDGVELAKAYKLNPLIVNFIKEHHGTCLIKYFYNKAKELENPEMHTTEETHYRYGGPKPQSKETAIVLLADSVEAAARSLPEPSVSRLQGVVEKIVTEKLMEGELEECDLTLKDLNSINKVFVKILTGIFHSRIEYPDKEGEQIIGHRPAQSAEKKEDRSKDASGQGQENIKKLKVS